jgi:hypothetical protein
VTPRPWQGLRIGAAPGSGRGGIPLWSVAVFVVLVAALFAVRGGEIADALRGFPVWAALAGLSAQLAWLVCRGEAWRLSVGAAQRHTVPRPAAHSANALAFLAGVVQQAATVPVRAVTLRRIAPGRSPPLEQVLIADAPVLALEGALMGLLLLAAALTAPGLPAWAPAASLAGGLAALGAMFAARRHFHDRGLTAGLRVLADRRRGPAMAAIAVAMSALALTRSWAVLAGFGLPDDFASVVLFLAALGVLGALPLGPTASPAAALAVFGSISAASAASAGIAMTATTLGAVTVYGAIALFMLGRGGGSPRSAFGRGERRERAADGEGEAEAGAPA